MPNIIVRMKLHDLAKYAKGVSVSSYVLERKSYLGLLECLNYVLPLAILVGLILNFFSKDFVDFKRN
jgi:hypothetical protein